MNSHTKMTSLVKKQEFLDKKPMSNSSKKYSRLLFDPVNEIVKNCEWNNQTSTFLISDFLEIVNFLQKKDRILYDVCFYQKSLS